MISLEPTRSAPTLLMGALRVPGKMVTRVLLALVAASAGVLFAAASTSSETAVSLPTFRKVSALFERYCFECHGDGMKKGKLALDDLLLSTNWNSAGNRGTWEKAWKIVRHEFMPPAGADQPTPLERKAITQWIEQAALGIDYENPDP